MSDLMRVAAVERIGRVLTEIAWLRERLIFIGGAVLPLLVDVTERFEAPRTTNDVDAITATASYPARHRIEEELHRAGFRPDPRRHIGRYISPSNEIFDLSFSGQHTGSTGSRTDELAIETATRNAGPPEFRHLSATGLLLMKTAAYFDRGVGAPYASKDLADLAVLLVGVPGLQAEVRAYSAEVKQHVRAGADRLRGVPDLDESLRIHFRDRRPIPPDTPDSLAREALQSLDELSRE